MTEEPARRRYDSLRRTAQAQQTSADIARAARTLFVAKGWAATTVRDVAREAGVSVPTIYAAYGNKNGLTWALADSADLSADVSQLLAELETAPEPPRQLAAMIAYDRRLFERAGEVIVLLREAGRTEPELAQAYRDARNRADDAHRQVLEAWPPHTFRPGVDLESALDIYAALCNIDVYTELTVERGWSPDRVEKWWRSAVTRELLAESR
ncbi:TetR/AcrR family transcriptional regulator [Nocardia colli]|uniref:TetR/AcrR family transcriptional regulator n=1 Tax=Nocardia colli TaxID=2545717 RepID=A0A5N0DL91_9NOCA|nr:TetR/AcrR family transcriptional regulator [Nocardia colli]KAA8877503.1 TetR/AcrR family transcriptional regulator [Nocardia colli]